MVMGKGRISGRNEGQIRNNHVKIIGNTLVSPRKTRLSERKNLPLFSTQNSFGVVDYQ